MRDGELGLLKKKAIIESIIFFLMELTPNLITIAIFGTYIYTGHNIDAKAAFTLVSTLMVLQVFQKSLFLFNNLFRIRLEHFPTLSLQ